MLDPKDKGTIILQILGTIYPTVLDPKDKGTIILQTLGTIYPTVLDPKDKGTIILQILGTIYPTTQSNAPEDEDLHNIFICIMAHKPIYS